MFRSCGRINPSRSATSSISWVRHTPRRVSPFVNAAFFSTACASTLGDAYCSLAWGTKLATKSDAETAAGVLRGLDDRLTPEEQAMAQWARKVARDPNSTTPADVQAMRDAGFSDAQIFGITAYVALRIAFSTVNDALGARPDSQFRSSAPEAVLDAVTYGRPIDE
jgi:alkylhydroperoxidase family enzyme